MRQKLPHYKVPENVEVIPNLVSSPTIERLLKTTCSGIRFMRFNHGLPWVRVPGPRANAPIVVFDLEKVLAWAKHYRFRTYLLDRSKLGQRRKRPRLNSEFL